MKRPQERWQLTRVTLTQLIRDVRRIESQVALLRLDMQANGVLPKPKIEIDSGMETFAEPVGWCVSSSLDHMNAHPKTDQCIEWMTAANRAGVK